MKQLIEHIEALLMLSRLYRWCKKHDAIAHILLMFLWAQVANLLATWFSVSTAYHTTFAVGIGFILLRELYGLYTSVFSWEDVRNGFIGLISGLYIAYILRVFLIY